MSTKKYKTPRGVYIPMTLAKEIGIRNAFLYRYLLEKRMANEGKVLHLPVRQVMDETGLSDYRQRMILRDLEGKGYVAISHSGQGYIENGLKLRGYVRCIELLGLPSEGLAEVASQAVEIRGASVVL